MLSAELARAVYEETKSQRKGEDPPRPFRPVLAEESKTRELVLPLMSLIPTMMAVHDTPFIEKGA